jgi:hypothetical protein
MASRAMTPIIENTKNFALSYPDVQTFLQATPSNIFLVEGTLESDPDNKQLRLTASMLYFSYAFACIEDTNEAYASYLYWRGFTHARAVLLMDSKIRAAWDKPLGDFKPLLSRFSVKDVPAIVWAAANWTQFISLHLDSTAVLPDIPRVTALLDRACELDGTYFMGLPHIILGILHAFRPPMLGGDPKASQESFAEALRISQGRFFLRDYFFAKYYCYRMQDSEAFEKSLLGVIHGSEAVLPRYRLLNAIAKEKAKRLLQQKDDIF